MKRRASISLVALAVLTTACVSSEVQVENKPGKTPVSGKQGAKDVAKTGIAQTKSGLAAQSLNPGECGLFLWTRRESPEFVFFSKSGTETAKFWYDKAEQALNRTGAGGDVFGQQLTEQFFSLPDGRTLELDMTPGDLLVGGQRVPEATLKVLDADGWATMIPAAGVTVCQPG